MKTPYLTIMKFQSKESASMVIEIRTKVAFWGSGRDQMEEGKRELSGPMEISQILISMLVARVNTFVKISTVDLK